MAAVLGVLLGLVALLSVPVGVAFRLKGIEPLQGRVTMRWLFGLVRTHVDVARSPRAPAKRAAERAHGGERARSRGRASRAIAVLRRPAFRRRACRLAGDLLRAAHVSRLRLRMRLGLGDPAETGRLWAILGPLAALAHTTRSADLWIQPEFIEPVLEFDARGRLRVVPLHVAFLAVAFALSPASIRALLEPRGGDA